MSEQNSDDGTTSDEPPVTVSILHGGFDCARFALMVGVYADEEPSGAERFLDRQFDELLSGWRDAGHYPGPVGTSVFVEPGTDVAEGAEPCGAYLVGLGTGLALTRSQLRVSVTQALVDRCLRLYPEAAARAGVTDARHVDVGVSTALLGVRDDEGLRVEDAVNAILEGLRDANQTLAHYEQGRRIASRVRVTRIEFVERYAHRARLAAIAVRRARAAIDLPETFDGLESVVVDQGVPEAGALPAGAAVWERERTWQRYAITSPSQARPAATGDGTSGPLQIEISAMGRDARADRALHRIDRESLEALTATVAGNRSDADAVRTLRDRLVPYDLRGDFLSAPALHLVVDAVTANYPWELMAGPTSGAGAGAVGTGSVLRMFAESEARRMHPVRAQHRRALVVGAGHTVPGADLTGALAEARAVAELLTANDFDTELLLDDETLSDGEQRITLADLNIRLSGDHQIVHLACHGVHDDADPEAAGALLTPTFRLTADFVDAMPVVPELVVVNSCYNAKIGLHRLAAGLARSLMGIGVRAVVAAGWPIEDAAAQRFAHRLYTDMLAGRAFGDAVTAARLAATQGQGATWAAYQCYGDPTFVLRGVRATSTPVDTVLSVADLEDRLDALLTEIADLSRPRPGQGHDRRALLRDQLGNLEKWAKEHARENKPVPLVIRRKLAAAATRLGDFDRAATWYRTALDATTPGGLAARESSPLDLQQAANCVARGARVLVRAGGPDAFTKAVAALAEAEGLATAAMSLLAEDESISILASVHKKWAATDPARRDALVARACDTLKKLSGTRRGDYGLENRFQLVALDDPAEARRLVDAAQPLAPVSEKARCRDEAPHRGVDFWGRAVRGDLLLTEVMTAGTGPEAKTAAARMVAAYEDAFRRRSTFAERYSSIDHLQDLVDLLPPDDHRRAALDDALTALAIWRGFSVSARTEPPGGTDTTRSGPAAPARTLRGQRAVSVDAVHAGCGDCLLVTYQGTDDTEHRILIDGGLGGDYATGLGRVVGDAGPPFPVDVAVVSHIDSDHIGGMLEALRLGRVEADDFWFNGRDQIADLVETTATRSARQGDALGRLVPTDRRNRAVGGGAMVVGPDGLLDIDLPGGAHVVLLSPSRKRLEDLLTKWPEPVRDAADDGVARLLEAFRDPVERGPRTMGRDPSEPNGSSIAFLFEHDGASVLFTADAWASELETSLTALLQRRRTDDPTLTALPVSLFKLSHHGSMNNVTEKLLRLVAPERLLICTDGSKTYRHPDVETLDLVASVYPQVPVLFTDDTTVIRDRAAHIGATVPNVSPVRVEL